MRNELLKTATKRTRSGFHIAIAALLVFGFAGCSEQTREGSATEVVNRADADMAAFAAPTELKAELVEAGHVDLVWKHNATEAGGYWIEFTTPGDDFVKIGAAWPEATTFRHPDVAQGSTFIYYVRPFFGRPSEVVEVNTAGPIEIKPAPPVKGDYIGPPPPNTEGPLEDLPSVEGDTVRKASVRTTATFAAAVPTGVTAKLSSATGVDLRWRDNATDEDGYLVEISGDQKEFKICALLPPDATSFRKTGLPADAKSYFRIRAFFYGMPSEMATVFTGARSTRQAPMSGALENTQ